MRKLLIWIGFNLKLLNGEKVICRYSATCTKCSHSKEHEYNYNCTNPCHVASEHNLCVRIK